MLIKNVHKKDFLNKQECLISVNLTIISVGLEILLKGANSDYSF